MKAAATLAKAPSIVMTKLGGNLQLHVLDVLWGPHICACAYAYLHDTGQFTLVYNDPSLVPFYRCHFEPTPG